MAKIDLTSLEWRELIFQGKNKQYGAYKMRSESDHRHNVAVLIVAVATLVGVNVPRFSSMFKPKEEPVYTDPYVISNIDDLKDDNKKVDEVDVTTPPPPELMPTIRLTSVDIIADKDMPENDKGLEAQSVLNQSTARISIFTVEGTPTGTVEKIRVDQEPGTGNVEAEPISTYIEQMPLYPGGEEELLKFISTHLNYPVIDIDNGVEGKVFLRFVVTKTGEVDKVEILKSLSRTTDKEAIRVVKMLPKFVPGKQNGKPVAVWYNLPITYKLENH